MATAVLPESDGRTAAVLPMDSSGLRFPKSIGIADIVVRGGRNAHRRHVLFSPHGAVLRRPELISIIVRLAAEQPREVALTFSHRSRQQGSFIRQILPLSLASKRLSSCVAGNPTCQ